MTILPHLAARIVGTPLMVERARMETILSVIGPRVGIDASGFVPDVPPPNGLHSLIVTPNGIALVPIYGTLVKRVGVIEAASGLTSYAAIEEMILDAATDPAVRAILLDIDSPGGEVGGVFDLASMIREVGQSKPVWAMANDAFSAAYLLALPLSAFICRRPPGWGASGSSLFMLTNRNRMPMREEVHHHFRQSAQERPFQPQTAIRRRQQLS